MIDVHEHINAVRREVGGRVRDAGELRTVTLTRVYGAPVEDVWDACTSAERLPRWFLPVSGDLRLGGRFQLEGNAGGTIERCEPPSSFAATWEFNGAVSWITLTLTPTEDGGTRFALEHLMDADDHWEQYGPGATGVGWELGLVGLALHLETGEASAEAGAAWVATDEARQFMTLCSAAWREAAVTGGLDPEWAGAAAERNTQAYTAA